MDRSMKKLLAIFLVLMLLSADICAIAEAVATLTLPSALQIIEEEAFAGNTSIEKVIVPDGTTEIRSRAFADSSMTELVLPDSLTFIAEDAFECCGEFALIVPENCYAYDRCVELGLIKLEEPDPSVIESLHPYLDDFDYTWTYNADADTESVTITFSADTETEDDYDFIYLYTLDDVQVGKYSGTELAGQSVTIDGTGFKLRLTSDEAWDGVNAYYGFKLDSIVPKKAVPLIFESITAESNAVNAGETIRWTVATTGGKAPVYYDYTVLLGEEEVATGTIEAPNVIEYTPVRAGEYKLSVIARDSADVVLPAHVSDVVTVTPSTAYPESAHPYAANTDQSWVYAAEANVESLTVTFSEETKTESRYDYIYLYDQNGAQIGKYDGTTLAGQSIEIQGSSFTIRLTSDGSNEYHGFTVTNIEKYIPGPLSFVSLTVDKAKSKTGELITWTMETEGGSRPVTYEYTVTLNGEIKDSGSVTRPEQITYVPMEAGDYIMGVLAKDAEGNELPTQTSQIRITQREVTPETDFIYEAIDGLYARITGYTGTDTVVIIPEMIGEYTISEIGEKAFKNSDSLVSVIIPDTVTKLGVEAFCYCDSLAAVDLGEGVVEVCNFAFYGCSQLQRISFPDSVTTMGKGVLNSCSKLSYVGYPQNWESANSAGEVFANCPKLTQIDVPIGTTIIPNYAFANCANLRKITLPEGLEHVYHHAFSNCTGLTEMVYPSTIKTLGGLDGCTGIKQIIIPEGTEIIGTNAFDSIPIDDIVLPDSVVQINDYAFRNCSNLKNVVFGEELEQIGLYAFANCTSLTAADLPDSVTTIGAYVFSGCRNLEYFDYPVNWSTVTRVNSYSDYGHHFDNCIALTSIEVPEGVTRIPYAAFANATYIKEISLPSTLKTLAAKAFYGCTAIREMNLPDGVEQIGYGAFENCNRMLTIELPDSISDIGCYAFANCSALTELRLPVSWSTISLASSPYEGKYYLDYGHIFDGCTLLHRIEIPEGATRVPNYALLNASYVTEIAFPSTLTEIGCGAFEGCNSLTAVQLPDSVTTIGCYAFASCANLSTINFPVSWKSVTKSGSAWSGKYYLDYGHTFDACPKLETIVVPEGVTRIPSYSLSYTTSLTSVTLPSTLKEIGNSALRGSALLEKIYIAPNVTTIEANAFADCPNLTIHCEWGSAALQYAIDNSIPYYYLSLTGASVPKGTLYKGDGFALYGYVRSSDAITNITGAIYASDGSVLQEVSIIPEVTDYNLNGYYDANLRFGELPLGNYSYKLVATAGSETEILASSSFTIAPPPLRIGLNNAVVPSGLTNAGDGIVLSGSIISNYAITNVTVGVYTLDGREIYAYRAAPGTTSFALVNAASSLPIENLPLGEYLFRVTATSNGITKNLSETVFQPGNYSADVDEELAQEVLSFINQSGSGTFFTTAHINNALGKMGFQEILIMAINSRNSWLWGTVGQIFEENHQNPYLIELYEKEILDLICEMNPDTILIENPDAEFMSWTQSLVKGFSIGLTDYQDKLGGLFEEDIKQLNKTLGKFNEALGGIEMTVDFANSIAKVMQNYENGLLILNQIAETVDAESNPELATAIDRMRAKFKSQTFNILINAIELETKEILKAGVGEVTKALVNCASKFDATMNGGVLYSIFNLAIDTTMKLTGGDEIAKDYQTFMIQVNNYTTGMDAYSSARNAILAGDTSNEAINRFVCAFTYAKQAALRTHNTILKLEGTTSSERESIRDYISKLESISFSN